jgi:sterol desaturase/sphingolipid hydroxylase (fatty acid hydroxylase superfamily)
MNTATYHNLHHTQLRGNYGLMFRFWDRLLGTEIARHDSLFLERSAAHPAEAAPGSP